MFRVQSLGFRVKILKLRGNGQRFRGPSDELNMPCLGSGVPLTRTCADTNDSIGAVTAKRTR